MVAAAPGTDPPTTDPPATDAPATDAPATTPTVAGARPRSRKRSSSARKSAAPPVLVEVHRGEVVESRHRGHVVQVDAAGEVLRAVGASDVKVMLRSTVKPFGVVALIESGAADDLLLTPSELAIMCASHTGEDKHVRTLQAIFRRASVTQAALQCGSEGAPSDERTAGRLARDGETPGPIRQGCSGFHAASILMSAYAGWSVEDYTDPKHPSQVAVRQTVARLLGRKPASLKSSWDNCGVLTYQVSLADVARGYLLLAYPESAPDEARSRSAAALTRVRDAMMGAPEMVGGTYDNLDTELMRRRPGGLVAKAGADGMQAIGLVADAAGSQAAGIAIKIEDGDMSRRATKASTVEALAQVGVLDDRDLRALQPYHHPTVLTPGGSEAVTALPRFELPVLHEPPRTGDDRG